MSMESGTGVTRQKSDLKPEPEPKRLKSEAELRSEQKLYYDFDPIFDGKFKLSDFSVYDDDPEPYAYGCDDFVYKNKAMRKIEEEDALYRELSRKLSPYDAIPHPPNSMLLGGNPIQPIGIERDRVFLTKLSQLALEDYNNKNNQGSFVFHDLVKCTMGTEDVGTEDDDDDDDDDVGCFIIYKYYITFQAKENPDSPAITFFQGQVWDYKDHAEPPLVVKECHIKSI